VETTGWKPEEAGTYAEQMHDRFARALESWWRAPVDDELAERRSGA
jgi:hypothetical protein